MFTRIFALLMLCVVVSCPISVWAHCQIPCGIFEDNMRFDMIAEHITTIEKSMQKITELSSAKDKDMNQLVRWIMNKENHAEELSSILTYYFMAQRVKPVENPNEPKFNAYMQQIQLLHWMLVTTMKCKQSTDLNHIASLRSLLERFKNAYLAEAKHDHKHDHKHDEGRDHKH